MRSRHAVLQTVASPLFIPPVQAGVTRMEIISRADLAGGREFGLADYLLAEDLPALIEPPASSGITQ